MWAHKSNYYILYNIQVVFIQVINVILCKNVYCEFLVFLYSQKVTKCQSKRVFSENLINCYCHAKTNFHSMQFTISPFHYLLEYFTLKEIIYATIGLLISFIVGLYDYATRQFVKNKSHTFFKARQNLIDDKTVLMQLVFL